MEPAATFFSAATPSWLLKSSTKSTPASEPAEHWDATSSASSTVVRQWVMPHTSSSSGSATFRWVSPEAVQRTPPTLSDAHHPSSPLLVTHPEFLGFCLLVAVSPLVQLPSSCLAAPSRYSSAVSQSPQRIKPPAPTTQHSLNPSDPSLSLHSPLHSSERHLDADQLLYGKDWLSPICLSFSDPCGTFTPSGSSTAMTPLTDPLVLIFSTLHQLEKWINNLQIAAALLKGPPLKHKYSSLAQWHRSKMNRHVYLPSSHRKHCWVLRIVSSSSSCEEDQTPSQPPASTSERKKLWLAFLESSLSHS